MSLKQRFEDALQQHGNMRIDWIDENVALAIDSNSHDNRCIAVLNSKGVTFYDADTFEKVNHYDSVYEYAHADDVAKLILVKDVELCISTSHDPDDEGMSYEDLHKACVEHCVIEHYDGVSCNGWSMLSFAGLDCNIRQLFKETLGMDEESIEDLIYDEESNVER